ncbi:MAG: hypothetical protein WC289_02045 [Patescibacteria group bacterium]
MIWQDIVITVASIIFSVALVPQVYAGYKEKKGTIAYGTSVPTFVGLYVLCVAYFTLELYLSTVVCFITASLWLILCIQKRIYR